LRPPATPASSSAWNLSTPTAARLLDELGADAPIGIVLDPANLLTSETVTRQDEIIGEAIDLLGGRIIGTQAKDVVAFGYSGAPPG
jgi:sugar phosphate isomerase/epimerase